MTKFWNSRKLAIETEEDIEGSTAPDTATPEKHVESVSEEAANLRKALEKEREIARKNAKDAKKYADDLKAFQAKFADIDPTQYQALLQERENLATKQSEQERLQAELTAKFETERIKLSETYTAKVTELEAERNTLQQQILSLTRSNLLEKEFVGANGRTEISGGISYFQVLDQFVGGKFQLSEDSKRLIVIGDDGKPLMSSEDPKKPMPPAEYLKSLHQHEVLGSCFKLENRPSGSGQNLAPRSTGSNSNANLTRKDRLLQARSGG